MFVRSYAYEANNFAGTMAAVEIMLVPPSHNASDSPAAVINCSVTVLAAAAERHATRHVVGGAKLVARQTINFLLWPLVFVLYLAGTRRLSLLCSGVVGAMIVCFVATLAGAGVPGLMDFLHGLVPSIPPGAAEIVLAVMGTTSIPVNILMGSSLARQTDSLTSMRRGVALASGLSGLSASLSSRCARDGRGGSHAWLRMASAGFGAWLALMLVDLARGWL